MPRTISNEDDTLWAVLDLAKQLGKADDDLEELTRTYMGTDRLLKDDYLEQKRGLKDQIDTLAGEIADLVREL